MKKILSLSLIVLLCLSFGMLTSCNKKDKYVHELNRENFNEFFYFSEVKEEDRHGNGFSTYIVEGVLKYAYYENVVATFDITYDDAGYEYRGVFVVKLNAAGCSTFRSDNPELLKAINCTNYRHYSTTRKVVLKNITGKVDLLNP